MRLVYLAHPVSGDVAGNIARAKRWLRWLHASLAPGHVVIAPWLLDIEVLQEDASDPPTRLRALERCRAVAARCDAIALVGGRVSAGMALERDAGAEVLDFTALGPEPPDGETP